MEFKAICKNSTAWWKHLIFGCQGVDVFGGMLCFNLKVQNANFDQD